MGPAKTLHVDLCIYGATAAGLMAGIQARRLGLTVALLDPSPRIGGMTTHGLGYTDIGNKSAVGGLAREFYRRVGRRYGVPEAWTFEPHIALHVFETWLSEAELTVHAQQFLAALERDRGRITALRTESGLVVRAKQFIDATYEGDLMAQAGVSFDVGRESNATYGETLNGAQLRPNHHQFNEPVSPFVVKHDPTSGLLPGIEWNEPVIGAGDRRVQAYCFRVCLTDDPRNRTPFARPADYDERWHVLARREIEASGWHRLFTKFDRLRRVEKTDTNNWGAVSTDFIGQNYAWPLASYAEREVNFQAHVTYQQGLHWFLANDPSLPPALREAYGQWGLCRDEFTETGGWPTQLYVREARRMISDYVMTEHDCRGARVALDSIGLAAYTMDSHNCRRFVRGAQVLNEGNVEEHGFSPYPISYRAIVPRGGECENLLVPVCLAASHIAYGSIRMEPVFMILGQSAATAAYIAIQEDSSVQAVPYADLRAALLRDEQVLAWRSRQPATEGDLHVSEAR